MASTKYTESLFNKICDSIAQGETLTDAASEHGVDVRTVSGWLGKKQEIRATYIEACRVRALVYVERILEAVAELNGATVPESTAIKIKIDTYKWFLTNYYPRVFGEKLKIEQEAPPAPLTPEQLNTTLGQLAKAAGKRVVDADPEPLAAPPKVAP